MLWINGASVEGSVSVVLKSTGRGDLEARLRTTVEITLELCLRAGDYATTACGISNGSVV